METNLDHPAARPLAPVSSSERIQALDVVRGFALIGILMMNVEFFNRPIAELGTGIQPGLTGADWWVSWFVQYFVTGKFWTTFSLLFGMGFAVMLTRAEAAQRDFLVPYLRRIAALALFGTLHYIFLWSGDILFAYAVGATWLLILLYGKPKYIAAAIGALFALGFVPGCKWAFGIAGSLAFCSVLALWLRNEKEVRVFGRVLPLVAVLGIVIGAIALIAGGVMWILPKMPPPARFGLPIFGFAVLTVGILSAKYHEPRKDRAWRLGVGNYVFGMFMMTTIGATQYFFPEPQPATPPATVASASAAAAGANVAPPAPATKQALAGAASQPAAKKQPTDAEKAAERAAERAKRQKERAEKIATEKRVMATGTYLDAVTLRAKNFLDHAAGEFGFATIIVGMFLLGFWFVRSGIMENTAAHLPLFRKLALFGLPVGIGLGLLGSTITTYHVPGSQTDGWQMTQGLLMLGNLPACLGYVSLVVLMMHSKTVFAKINLLAPFGRMALTNYLTQSLIAATFFYGYGFGNWGISRVSQMGYVVVIALAQIAFSHFWLSRFRYGPLEWLWRAVTYWKIPPLRIARPGIASAVPHHAS
ncbi:MAG TPA: DUF418 domain-containing protein [Paucimonas sp.]|nr:DUF418 domain-containing protein [Paucimonas sp.]